jgi:hypothetical protein
VGHPPPEAIKDTKHCLGITRILQQAISPDSNMILEVLAMEIGLFQITLYQKE